jgi:hypothetical protein
MSSVMSLTTLLGAISVPGLALALVTARARRYLRLQNRGDGADNDKNR